MPDITYFNLFTCRLLQRLLGCAICRGHVRGAFTCPAPRPALREAVLWWRAKCWWDLLSLAFSGYERTEEPTEHQICPFCIPWSKSAPVHTPCCMGSAGKGRKKISKIFLSSVICQETGETFRTILTYSSTPEAAGPWQDWKHGCGLGGVPRRGTLTWLQRHPPNLGYYSTSLEGTGGFFLFFSQNRDAEILTYLWQRL